MKVAIYCRLSEEDKNKQDSCRDSESIQNQKAMLTEYSKKQGWEIYKIYSDDDYAGADRGRPEFCRLLSDAENKKFDIVLCKTQSRFTRELELVEKYIHGLFPIWGIRFVSIVDNADTENKGNKKSRQINGLVNEWYLEDMSENIRSVLINKRKNGFHIGSFALYGYKKDPVQKGHLIIDAEAAEVVKEVFSLFSLGYGKTSIAKILNERGIPNPTEYKRQNGLRYKQPTSKSGTLWKYSAISSMLKNEIYIGNMVQGKYGSISYKTKKNKPRPMKEWYIVKGTHEPIIDRESWDTVQKLISEKTTPRQIGTRGIFAGKVRCSFCGYVMHTSKSKDKRYLRCPNRQVSENACIGAFISIEKLEKIIVNELDRLIRNYLDKEKVFDSVKINSNFNIQKSRLEKELISYQKRSEECTKAIREIYMDKLKGLINEDDFIGLSCDLKNERESMGIGTEKTKEKIKIIDQKINMGESRKSIIEEYINPKKLNADILEIMIDYISVGKRLSKTNNVPVEIHWNF